MNKLILSLLLLAPALADAATQTGSVTGYVTTKNTNGMVLLVKLDSAVQAGCNTTGRFAMPESDVRFKSTQAAVMASHHSQSPVKVSFAETCTAWTNSYDLQLVCVGDVVC